MGPASAARAGSDRRAFRAARCRSSPSQPKDLGAMHANRQPVAEVRSTQQAGKGFQRLCGSPDRRLGAFGVKRRRLCRYRDIRHPIVEYRVEAGNCRGRRCRGYIRAPQPWVCPSQGPSCMNPPTRQDAALLSVVDAFVFARALITPAPGRHADQCLDLIGEPRGWGRPERTLSSSSPMVP